MNVFLLLLAALHRNAVLQNQCAFPRDNNSTMPAPIFYRGSYSFNVNSSLTEVGKVNAYSPWNSKLWYSLVGTDDVTVDTRSGALRVKSVSLRDTVHPHTFYAVATDKNFKSATVAVNMWFNSTGSLTTPPPASPPRFFQTVYTLRLSSSTPVNTSVLQTMAGGVLNIPIVYSISNTSYFWVNRSSGVLHVARSLRGTTGHNFSVTAAYRSTPSLTSVAWVSVYVQGNTSISHGLSFSNSPFGVSVYTNIARGAYVATIRATSRVPSQQNQVRYYLSGSPSLRINITTGRVYINMLPLYNRTRVNVAAILGGVRVSTSLTVNKACRPGVRIANCFVDPCTVAPVCEAAKQATCLANYCGGCNAEFYYLGDSINCTLPTTLPPVRYTPIFSSPQYKIKVPSNTTINSVVGRVYASSAFGQVVLYGVINSTYFAVDRITGELFLTRPLTNMKDHYFTVSAWLQSSPSNNSLAYVHVQVATPGGVNLTFGTSWYKTQVTSDIGRKDHVITVRANASSNQDKVRYYIQGSNGSIAINETTGAVFVNNLPLYNRTIVNIQARLDNVTASLVLDITKVCPINKPLVMCAVDPCQTLACPEMANAVCLANYCGGCFADYYVSGDRGRCPDPVDPLNIPSFEFRVMEGTTMGTVVANMNSLSIPNTSLPDAVVTFSLDDGQDGTFQITNRGDLLINGYLDYERRQRYDFIVNVNVVTRNSARTMPVRVTVQITNINDNTPRFIGVLESTVVSTDTKIGEPLIKFLAIDADVQDTITYQLTMGNATLFGLDGLTGVLTLRRTLSEGVYTLQVTSSDNGIPPRSSYTLLEIRAVNQVSGLPRFADKFADFRLLESVPVNTLVKTIPVISPESVTYSEMVESDPQDVFRVNSSTGDIYTNRLLDRETMPVAAFVMEALNQQNGLRTNLQVFLTIVDVNDNSPVFPFSMYDINIRRDWQVGQIVFTAEAIDVDAESQLVYYIASGDDGGVFAMNGNNLVLAISPRNLVDSSLALTIGATDGFYHTTAQLRIRVYGGLGP